MIAGSQCSFFAKSGRSPPISLEMMIVAMSDSDTTTASVTLLYMIQIRRPFARESAAPTIREMRNSLNSTRNTSLSLISSSASPRMISVELWEPQFPPVSISIGMKETRRGTTANASSYRVITMPVNVEEIISTSSQTIRFFACSKVEVSK